MIPPIMANKFSLHIVLAIWILLIGAGLSLFSWYSTTENSLQHKHRAPSVLPVSDKVLSVQGKKTCILFLHPHCPCSKATLTEWQRAVQAGSSTTTFYAVFFGGDGSVTEQKKWLSHTYLWNAVAHLPSVVSLIDSGSVLSSQFGAYTSGFVVLYDNNNKLLFSGGLTVARGHEGYNSYSRMLSEMLSLDSTSITSVTSPVYGCGLQNVQ